MSEHNENDERDLADFGDDGDHLSKLLRDELERDGRLLFNDLIDQFAGPRMLRDFGRQVENGEEALLRETFGGEPSTVYCQPGNVEDLANDDGVLGDMFDVAQSFEGIRQVIGSFSGGGHISGVPLPGDADYKGEREADDSSIKDTIYNTAAPGWDRITRANAAAGLPDDTGPSPVELHVAHIVVDGKESYAGVFTDGGMIEFALAFYEYHFDRGNIQLIDLTTESTKYAKKYRVICPTAAAVSILVRVDILDQPCAHRKELGGR